MLNRSAIVLVFCASMLAAPATVAAGVGGDIHLAGQGGHGEAHMSSPAVQGHVGVRVHNGSTHNHARAAAGTRVYGWRGRYHGHRRHSGGGVGIIIGDDYPYDGYYDDCAWLHDRAIETGSRYWWRRYEDCVD